MLDQRFSTPWLISLALNVFVKYSSHLIPPRELRPKQTPSQVFQMAPTVWGSCALSFLLQTGDLRALEDTTKMWYWSQFATTHILTPWLPWLSTLNSTGVYFCWVYWCQVGTWSCISHGNGVWKPVAEEFLGQTSLNSTERVCFLITR